MPASSGRIHIGLDGMVFLLLDFHLDLQPRNKNKRIQRWRTPDFLAPEGPAGNREEAAISGPIGDRAEVLNWGPIRAVIGPSWRPRRVLASGPSPVAREKTGGPFSRLKLRPRVEPRADTVRRRAARERRGTPDESPRYSGGVGGGPGEGAPRRAAEQRCCWTRARPLIVLGPARDHGGALKY
ncbi:hypothetical protein NDU88_001995 [Pleurodeles waltl]|uniref:Uncharacterized protein n=1 Tax=Pleurodeles waltl TaxID=8319 RepID=A0AAV7W154_PLEWA|nr:hypothetical protein NDU88_001995 [Pleurodeles waltl]